MVCIDKFIYKKLALKQIVVNCFLISNISIAEGDSIIQVEVNIRNHRRKRVVYPKETQEVLKEWWNLSPRILIIFKNKSKLYVFKHLKFNCFVSGELKIGDFPVMAVEKTPDGAFVYVFMGILFRHNEMVKQAMHRLYQEQPQNSAFWG